MKARVKMMLPGFTGNMDDVVIYYNSKLGKVIARRKVKPAKGVSTKRTEIVFSLARRLQLSQSWHRDCSRYIMQYNTRFRRQGRAFSSWPAVWLKLMTAQMQARPDLDFSQMDRAQLFDLDLPCLSLARSVEAGFLEEVREWELLTASV